jgi:hypothetical protein
MPRTDKEKADEILKKRERARKGFAEHPGEGRDPLEKQEKRDEKIADSGVVLGLGMKRSG